MLQPNYVSIAVTFIVWALFSIGVPVALFLFARRVLRLLDRRSIHEEQLAALSEELRKLETRVEEVEQENERLREDQRFTRQLLEKPRTGRAIL